MTLTASFGFVGLGLVLLLVGAEALVRGAASVALRSGLSPMVVGLTVVAFGTSSPELVISVQAALAGEGGLAVGNVVGSNIANIALIIGVAATIRPMAIQHVVVRRDLPIVLAVSVILVVMLQTGGGLARWEGAMLLAGGVTYIAYNVLASRAQPVPKDSHPDEAALKADPTRPVWLDALYVLGGLALLVLGGSTLTTGAVSAATQLGVSEAVIGLTLVALGTSLPELATTVVAALRGEGDLALGNAVGSNAFNVMIVLGPAALIAPMRPEGVGGVDLGVMLAVVALVLVLMWTRFRLVRWEGLVLLAAYLGYIGWLVMR